MFPSTRLFRKCVLFILVGSERVAEPQHGYEGGQSFRGTFRGRPSTAELV